MRLKVFNLDHEEMHNVKLRQDISLSSAIKMAADMFGATETTHYWLIEDSWGNILASNIGSGNGKS